MRLTYLSLWKNEEDSFVHVAHDPQETIFNSGALLYLTPYRNLATKPIVQLFDVSLGRGASWKAVEASGITSLGFTLDVTHFTPGNYFFRFNENQPTQLLP